MRWDAVEVETVLEKIWDLHDKVSDAIHSISRAHFLRSGRRPPPAPEVGDDRGGGGGGGGFVFVKGETAPEDVAAAAAMADAKSLNAIRSALEDLEDQLEFFHTVQSQQQAERDAAIARLEQSRIILAMRLAEHQGKKYNVIKEAIAFVGEVQDKGHFVSPEDVYAVPHNQSGENTRQDPQGHNPRIMVRMLSYSLALAKNSFRLERIGGVLGNAAVFAVSMLAFLQLHQVSVRSKTTAIQYHFRKRSENRTFQPNSSRNNGKEKHLEVLLARG